MKRSMTYALLFGLLLSLAVLAPMAQAQSQSKATNPCNPCGDTGKKAENPCNGCDWGEAFYVDDARNVLTFESKAPLEKIVGTTSAIKGHIHIDPKDITRKPMAKFEVDLASMKTGIGLRDRHMRDQYLETEKYPTAVLTLDRLLKASSKQFEDQKRIKADFVATLELHGVKQKITVTGAELTYFEESETTRAKMPGDLIHIVADFEVQLPDYQIKIPKMVVLKLDKNVKVNVDVFATNAPPKASMAEPPQPRGAGKKAENPCNPCGM